MNVCENGVIRPMSPGEIAEIERAIAEAPEPEPTPADLIAELEARNQELTEFLEQMAQIYDSKEDTA
jgi:hypothetical protein